MMKKITIFFCWSVFLITVLCSCRQYVGQFILINNSGELITLAQVEICKQIIEINDIKPRDHAIGSFVVTGDSHYDVVIHFASGKKIKKQIGYVTHGFNYKHTFNITEANIVIDSTQVK